MGQELTPVPAAGDRMEQGHLGSVLFLLNKAGGSCPHPGAESAWGTLPEAVGAPVGLGLLQGQCRGDGVGWAGRG